MRVGIITYDFYPPIGGQGVYTYELYKYLNESDEFEVFVFSSRGNDLRNHVRIATFGKSGIDTLVFSNIVNVNIGKWIKKYKLDLVHLQGGPGGVFLLIKPKVPVIYTAHHLYSQQYKYLKKPIYKILMKMEKKAYENANKIIAVSTTTKKGLVDDYKINPEKVVVIHNGVDTKIFRPLNDVKKIPNSILFVGRLDKRKGVEYLIRAVKNVKDEIPDVKLYIIGDGDLKANLQKLAREEGVDNAVIFLGRVPSDELIKWYNSVEVFVLPSKFEGFGIVCIEAMACGTPVIGARVPGIVDIIEHGKTGLLVHPQNSKELGEAIKLILNDKKLRKKMSKECECATRKFSKIKIVQKIISVYKSFK